MIFKIIKLSEKTEKIILIGLKMKRIG